MKKKIIKLIALLVIFAITLTSIASCSFVGGCIAGIGLGFIMRRGSVGAEANEHRCTDADNNGVCDGCGILIECVEAKNIIDYDVNLYDENGPTGMTFNPANNKGKVTVILFWGVWCSPSLTVLEYCNEMAIEYADMLTVLAVHTSCNSAMMCDYIREYYSGSNILFGMDDAYGTSEYDEYYGQVEGMGTYPITIFVNENGEATHSYFCAIDKDDFRFAFAEAVKSVK